MNINNAFPSKYIKSGDCEAGDLVLTIASVSFETVGQGADAEQKPIVYFNEIDKGLLLNKTNAGTISNMYGPETDGWIGKRIAMFATEVDYGGKQTMGIRIRMKPPTGNGHKIPAVLSVAESEKAWIAEQSKATFTALVNALGAQSEDVLRAFGPTGVMAWIKAEAGRDAAAAAAHLKESQSF